MLTAIFVALVVIALLLLRLNHSVSVHARQIETNQFNQMDQHYEIAAGRNPKPYKKEH